MKIRLKSFNLISYFFFLFYFISYIGEATTIKYIVLCVYQVFLLLNTKKEHRFKHGYQILLILCGIFISLLISLLLHFETGGAIKTLSLIDLFILTYYIFPKSVNDFGFNEEDMIIIVTNSLFISLLIAFIFCYNDVSINLWRKTSAEVRHLFGFGVPSIVGYLCFIEIVFSFFLLTSRFREKRKKSLDLIKALLGFYMIYLADIRSAFVSVVIFFISYWFSKLPKNRKTQVFKILIYILTFIFAILFIFNIDMKSMNYIFSERFNYYQRAIKDVIDNGGFLFGLGSFRNSDVTEAGKIQVDNSFIDIFYQYGIVILFFFISLICKIYKELHRIEEKILKSDLGSKHYAAFINSYFFSVLVYSMVEKNLFSISSALSLVTFIFVFWYMDNNNQKISTEVPFCDYRVIT